MTWKRFMEIVRLPFVVKSNSELTFPNLGRGKTLGIDITDHHDVGVTYNLKTDQWNNHYYCSHCGLHGQYLHNMVNHEKEDKGVCIRCGNRLSGSYDNRPSVVVCLRKSAFPDGEVFYFWEFKDKDDKKIILDLQDSWRMTQELEFALDKLVVNPYPLSDSPSMRAKRFLDYLMDQPTSIPESDIRINKSLVEKEYNNLNLSKTKDN